MSSPLGDLIMSVGSCLFCFVSDFDGSDPHKKVSFLIFRYSDSWLSYLFSNTYNPIFI